MCGSVGLCACMCFLCVFVRVCVCLCVHVCVCVCNINFRVNITWGTPWQGMPFGRKKYYFHFSHLAVALWQCLLRHVQANRRTLNSRILYSQLNDAICLVCDGRKDK